MIKYQFSEVLNFWFDEQVKPQWFKKSEEFDRAIKERFESIYRQAKIGELDQWRNVPHSALALIIVLDQFPRKHQEIINRFGRFPHRN